MKKKFGLALLALLSVGLVGCGNKTSDSEKTSDTSASGAVEDTKLEITVSGTLKVGETVSFVSKYDGSPITPQSSVSYKAADATVMDITGNKATLNKAGTHSVRATYKTDAGADVYRDFTFTVEDAAKAITIAEARALAKNNTYTPVLVRGVVQATSGTSAYLADSTGGIFVYNWYFAETDTASVSNYSWTLGMTVEVYAYATAYYDAAQLCGSINNGDGTYTDLDGKYAVKIDDEITPIDAKETSEADLKALASADTGKMYKMTAEFVSGSIITTAKSTLKFKLGDTSFNLVTDGSTKKAFDKKISELKETFDALGLKAGDKVDIVAPLYSVNSTYNSISFHYMSQGASITKHIEKDTLTLDYTGDAKVGNTITLVPSYNGATPEGVTYTVTTGADLVSLDGNQVTLNAVGDVVIHAVYTVDGAEKTADLSFTIYSDEPVAINTVTADKKLVVKGVVSATNTQGFTVTDSTGTVYCHMAATPTVKVGDVVKVAGTTSTFNGLMPQFTNPTATKLNETSDVVVPDAVDLTTAIADGFVNSTGAISEVVKYKWTSTVSKDDSGYYLLNLAGSSTKIEYSYYGGTLEEGSTYEFEGFFIGYNTKYKYATMLLTDVSEVAPTEVTISLNKSSASVEVGKTLALTATVKLPDGVTDNSVTWESDNTAAATVDNGTVTGVAAGTANITVKSVADPTKTATCVVTVKEAVAGNEITVDIPTVFGSFITAGEISTTADDISYVCTQGLYAPADDTYAAQLRVYKNQTLTISSTKYSFRQIEFTCTASGTTKYGPGCFTTTDSNYTYNDTIGTWSNLEGTSSVAFKASSNQVRISAIKLTVVAK